MKKTTLIQCPLAFCLAVAFGVSALTAAENTPLTAEYEKTQDAYYKAQDANARKSAALEAKGQYAQAIKILEEKVVNELKNELERADNWRARRRLAEFSAKLRALRLKYGTSKLRDAEKAYAEGRYTDAMKFAVEAKGVCDELTADADEIATAARSRQTANEYRDKTNPEKIDQNLVAREKQIKAALAAARTLIKHQRYEAASVEIEKVYVLDPFNAEAGQLANELYKKYYVTGIKRRDADTAGQFAYEAWQWVEPVFPREIGGVKKVDNMTKSADDSGIQNKLNKIVFPKVQFVEADLFGVVDFINKRSKTYDTESGQGVLVDIGNIDSRENKDVENSEDAENDPEAANPRNTARRNTGNAKNAKNNQAADLPNKEVRVTLDVKNVSLRELLNYICYLTDMTYSVLEDRVVIGSVGVVTSKSYDASPALLQLVASVNKGGEVDSAAEKSEDGEDDAEGGKKLRRSKMFPVKH